MDIRRNQIALFCPLALLVMSACSTGPAPLQPGTPAFYWSAAREAFTAGDYLKAADHLAQLTRTDNEFTARAAPWRLVLTSGMARGFMDLADVFEAGARANRANPTPFRKQVTAYRNQAGSTALQFAETIHRFMPAYKEETVIMAFRFPRGSPAEVASLKKISGGIVLQASELEAIQKTVLERAVLLATCRAVGAPDDPAKAQVLFKEPEPRVSRANFLLAMANSLHDASQFYTPMKLDQPDRMKVMCDEALEALDMVPETKQSKELRKKIEATRKKIKVKAT